MIVMTMWSWEHGAVVCESHYDVVCTVMLWLKLIPLCNISWDIMFHKEMLMYLYSQLMGEFPQTLINVNTALWRITLSDCTISGDIINIHIIHSVHISIPGWLGQEGMVPLS